MQMNIYDIAKEAGVSISTVSRVANRKPCVKASTREKVQALLEKYNYFADEPYNPEKNKPRTAAILISDLQDANYLNNEASLIERYLWEHNCLCVLLHLSTEDGIQPEYITLLNQLNVEGIVMLGSVFQTSKINQQIGRSLSHLPIVMRNGYFDLPNVYGVLSDDKHGVRDCVDLLFNKGRRNIGYVYTNDQFQTSKLRLMGYESGMRRCGLEDRIRTATSNLTLEGGYEATKQIMRRHPELDGLIYADDVIALGGLRALRELGLDVPSQVSVIGTNNSLYSQASYPRLTSLDTKIAEGSCVVAQVLIGCMINNAGAKRLLLPCDIVEREST